MALCFSLISCNNFTLCRSSLGKTVKKEPGNEEGQQHFDDADKLLQEFQEAQVDRVGSRPSSNLSSLSNASERDQHHLGICCRSKNKNISAFLYMKFYCVSDMSALTGFNMYKIFCFCDICITSHEVVTSVQQYKY